MTITYPMSQWLMLLILANISHCMFIANHVNLQQHSECIELNNGAFYCYEFNFMHAYTHIQVILSQSTLYYLMSSQIKIFLLNVYYLTIQNQCFLYSHYFTLSHYVYEMTCSLFVSEEQAFFSIMMVQINVRDKDEYWLRSFALWPERKQKGFKQKWKVADFQL